MLVPCFSHQMREDELTGETMIRKIAGVSSNIRGIKSSIIAVPRRKVYLASLYVAAEQGQQQI